MNKKDFIELLNLVYKKENTIKLNENQNKIDNKILTSLLNVITNIKEDKLEIYKEKRIENIEIKIIILRAKIAELNNKKQELKTKISNIKNDYSMYSKEYDYSKMIHNINIEIISLSSQLEILQRKKSSFTSIRNEEIKNKFINRIKAKNVTINLEELSKKDTLPIIENISLAIKLSSPEYVLNLAKEYKSIKEELERNSCINIIPIKDVIDYYPSLKTLSSLELPTKMSSYLKTEEECTKILNMISKVENQTLREIKQLLELEYNDEKLDGIKNIDEYLNNIEIKTNYDFLRINQGKYDNNIAIQLRGYEQIYETKIKTAFKTEEDVLYINKLKKQITLLRRKIYSQIISWYQGQKKFNQILDFKLDSDNYETLNNKFDKIKEQIKNYKYYLKEAENVLKELNKKYKIKEEEIIKKSKSLNLDTNILDTIITNYYKECVDYLEQENVKKQIHEFIKSDNKKIISNDQLADQIASSWTNIPELSNIELYEDLTKRRSA